MDCGTIINVCLFFDTQHCLFSFSQKPKQMKNVKIYINIKLDEIEKKVEHTFIKGVSSISEGFVTVRNSGALLWYLRN